MIKKVWNGFKKVQSKIDFTPKLLAISDKYAKNHRVSFFLFLFFIITGFFGLFIPLIQGWLTIFLAFTFLGIKPLNTWMRNNKKAVSNIGTTMFMVAIVGFLFTTGTWITGQSENTPIDNIFRVINYGQDDLVQINTQVFNLIEIDYNTTQQALNIIEYKQTQGFVMIGGYE